MDITWVNHHKIIVVSIAVLTLLILLAAGEILYVAFDGKAVPVPKISRASQIIGSGSPLSYVVLGDSTAVAQGANYKQGYAVASAEHLAIKHTITWANYAVSGARAQDVLKQQLPKALLDKPDVVLIAVGANDVRRLTNPNQVIDELQQCIKALQTANPRVAIVLTGAPAMGTIPRFPQPIRWYAGVRTNKLNKLVVTLTKQTHTTFAPIAEKTGPIFRDHPEFFAVDRFHPNAAGYQVWKPIINKALDAALSQQ